MPPGLDGRDMGKLAICVPTLNHADIVREILEYSAEFLEKHDVDIYYYDSSDDDGTHNVVMEFGRKHGNVFYVGIPKGTEYGEKVDYIFSGYGLKKEYDYIWPLKDRNICNEYMLELLLSQCDGCQDIVLTICDGKSLPEKFCHMTSPIELYRKYAAQITSIETVIYNTGTILGDYERGMCDGLSQHQKDYWHYFYLFRKLAEIGSPQISIIDAEGAHILVSNYAESKWSLARLDVWINGWIKVNEDLPELYAPYKPEVIKQTTTIEELLGDRSRMMELHEMGVLTPETYEKYLDQWQLVSYVPLEIIGRIARGEYDIYHDITLYDGEGDVEKILLKMIRLLDTSEEAMAIPLGNLKKIVLDRVLLVERFQKMKALAYGSVEDIFAELEQAGSPDQKKKLLQMLLLFMR